MSDNSDNDVDPEVKLNEDDYAGLDTTNIIPRTQRRAAAAARTTPLENSCSKSALDEDDDEEDEDHEENDEDDESDEAEF